MHDLRSARSASYQGDTACGWKACASFLEKAQQNKNQT
jgi:hypothetical protein